MPERETSSSPEGVTLSSLQAAEQAYPLAVKDGLEKELNELKANQQALLAETQQHISILKKR